MSEKIRDQVSDKLDVRALSLIIFMSVVEFEGFVFARAVIKISEQDAWVSILIGTAFLAVNAYVMTLLAARFPRENFFEYCPKVWGKPIGFLIKGIYLLYWFATLVIIFKDFSVANEVLFLPRTPNVIPLVLLGFGAYWVVSYGLATVTRFFQLMFLFLVLPLLVVAILGIGQIQIENFKPILDHDLGTLVKGGLIFAGIYQGLEIILFVAPFLTNPRKMAKHAVLGIVGGTFFPLVLGISAIGSLGVQNLKQSIWPGIDTVSSIALPGFPVERYELFLTMSLLIGLFTCICTFLYLFGYGLKEVFHLKRRNLTVGLSVLFAIGAVYLFPDYSWALQYREWLTLMTFLFITIFPLLTLIIAMVRGKGDAS